jgi:2-iminobutanoate/2-iminopropanoate deaminase
MKRVAINPQAGATNTSPLSPGLAAGPFLFVSGQIGIDQISGKVAEGGVEAQTEHVLTNLAAVLAAGGLGMDDVVKTTVFLTRAEDFAAMNTVYRRHFSDPFPTRSTVVVSALARPGLVVEIEAIALQQK